MRVLVWFCLEWCFHDFNAFAHLVIGLFCCRWGRWQDIIKHAHFKTSLVESDVQMIARAIVSALPVHVVCVLLPLVSLVLTHMKPKSSERSTAGPREPWLDRSSRTGRYGGVV